MRSAPMLAACAAVAALTTLGAAASADPKLDLAVSKGRITVTARDGWHINRDYPWKLVAGETKLDKSKFDFTQTTATLSGVPDGPAKLKGAVCSGDQCYPFTRDVTVP